jgi:hypothetical protein
LSELTRSTRPDLSYALGLNSDSVKEHDLQFN